MLIRIWRLTIRFYGVSQMFHPFHILRRSRITSGVPTSFASASCGWQRSQVEFVCWFQIYYINECQWYINILWYHYITISNMYHRYQVIIYLWMSMIFNGSWWISILKKQHGCSRGVFLYPGPVIGNTNPLLSCGLLHKVGPAVDCLPSTWKWGKFSIWAQGGYIWLYMAISYLKRL